MYKDLLQNIASKKPLTQSEVTSFISLSQSGNFSPVQLASILSALNVKGITPKELSYFVKSLSHEMPESFHFPEAIDICGTGGSGLPRINTSTLSAFILSALGVPVAKHGNNAASGRFGSFDLLKSLGIRIDLDAKPLVRLASQLHLAFLYARSFHPVMKHFASVRKEMGVPTVFNVLGPLLNPAQTKRQIIGTAFAEKMNLIAETAKILGKKHVMVVSGSDGLDEVTLSGKTFLVELLDGKIRKRTLQPSDFGVKKSRFEDIQGGSAKMNTQIALDILQGKCKTRHLDLVLVNVALALKLAGKVSQLKKGYQMAKACVESGKAYQQYIQYQQGSHAPSILLDIVQNKREELELRKKTCSLKKLQKQVRPSTRDFRFALLRKGLSFIAEIKKSSPCTGKISEKKFQVSHLAKEYEVNGAAAISVLTDQKYFGGSLDNLQKAQEATFHTPLLCKDFIIDPYQIYEARKYGADAVLLIAALLTEQQLNDFRDIARSLQMDVLVEVHNDQELKKVLRTKADIIGINNRDLHTFSVDIKTTQKLSRKIRDRIIVSESGIHSRADLKKLPEKIDAVLIGTSLMKSHNPGKKLRALMGPRKSLLKICGVQTVKEALHCQKLGVDFIGLNFVPTSDRRISYQMAQQIINVLRKKTLNLTQIVGVFMDHDEKEVNMAAEKLSLDFVQLSGNESLSYLKQISFPLIKGISIGKKSDLTRAKKYYSSVRYLLLDGKHPGSGKVFDHKLLASFPYPFFLAGGLDPSNLKDTLSSLHPYGVDIASGVEKNGKRDFTAIQKISHLLSS